MDNARGRTPVGSADVVEVLDEETVKPPTSPASGTVFQSRLAGKQHESPVDPRPEVPWPEKEATQTSVPRVRRSMFSLPVVWYGLFSLAAAAGGVLQTCSGSKNEDESSGIDIGMDPWLSCVSSWKQYLPKFPVLHFASLASMM